MFFSSYKIGAPHTRFKELTDSKSLKTGGFIFAFQWRIVDLESQLIRVRLKNLRILSHGDFGSQMFLKSI